MIETKRLMIRRFYGEDWADLYEYLSDPEVVRYEPYCVYDRNECRTEAVKRSNSDAFWAVCLKESAKLIGNIYLAEQGFGAWELGYALNRRYHGRGYATEAAAAIIAYAFGELGARRIVAMCNPDNVRSWRLLERLGMRREGHLKQNICFKADDGGNPVWQDTYEYGMLAGEWNRSI